MTWTQVPTRTSANTNASADVNQLQDNLDALKGGVAATAPTTTIEDLADAIPDFLVDIWAGGFDLPTSVLALAPLNDDTGTNIKDYMAHLMDGATDEGMEFNFRVPEDANTSGTITFEHHGYDANASPSGTVAIAIRFSPVADDGTESWDQAYGTAVVTSAVTMDTQDRIEVLSATETFSNLGFARGDLVKAQIYRDVSADTSANDFYYTFFRMRIPRA